jgi:hypothetical protein
LAALFLCRGVDAATSVDMILPTGVPVAYSSTFSFRTGSLDWGSAETFVTSATVASKTFTDGSASTGSLTVVSFAALSSATATGNIVITSSGALTRACVSGGGGGRNGNFNVCNPGDWAIDVVAASMTACNLAAAINSYNVILATCGINGASVVYTTAPFGSSTYNLFQINASTPALTVTQMSGGQDNQSFSINGKLFKANTDFFPVTSNTQTGTNIATAITNSSQTIGVVANSAAAGIVTTTSTATGLSTNYAMTSSSDSALSLSLPKTVTAPSSVGAMTGGAGPAYLVNTSTITIAGNGFSQGMQVLYTTPTVAITGLVGGTTYYIIEIPATGSQTSSFMLATSLANALAGTAVTLASIGTPTTADTYTLAPLAITGTPIIKWVVSNDNTNWLPYTTTPLGQTVPSQSYTAYSSTGAVNVFDFGHMDYGFLGMSVTAPLTGSLNVTAHVVGKMN